VQAEEKRTVGTPVTVESFKAWKEKFDKELAIKRLQGDEEHLKNMTPKEREEWKKIGTRLTGKVEYLARKKTKLIRGMSRASIIRT
jgi:hypothetical protein